MSEEMLVVNAEIRFYNREEILSAKAMMLEIEKRMPDLRRLRLLAKKHRSIRKELTRLLEKKEFLVSMA